MKERQRLDDAIGGIRRLEQAAAAVGEETR